MNTLRNGTTCLSHWNRPPFSKFLYWGAWQHEIEIATWNATNAQEFGKFPVTKVALEKSSSGRSSSNTLGAAWHWNAEEWEMYVYLNMSLVECRFCPVCESSGLNKSEQVVLEKGKNIMKHLILEDQGTTWSSKQSNNTEMQLLDTSSWTSRHGSLRMKSGTEPRSQQGDCNSLCTSGTEIPSEVKTIRPANDTWEPKLLWPSKWKLSFPPTNVYKRAKILNKNYTRSWSVVCTLYHTILNSALGMLENTNVIQYVCASLCWV